MRFRAFAIGASLLVVGVARADVPPPETEPCVGKKAGDACTYKSASGLCADSTCTKAVPSSDSGPVSYACMICKVSNDASAPKLEAGATPREAGAPAKDSGPTTTKDKDDSGCSMASGRARTLGPWILAGLVSALLFLAGRRRR